MAGLDDFLVGAIYRATRWDHIEQNGLSKARIKEDVQCVQEVVRVYRARYVEGRMIEES